MNNHYLTISNLTQLIILFCISISTVIADTRGIGVRPVINEPNIARQGTFRALIIGNDQYEDKNGIWKPLNTAVSDATSVTDILKQHYGFEDIKTLKNATRRDVLKALNQLSMRTEKNDSVLVYYAGHGYLDDNTERGYWVPVDATGDDQTTYLRNSTIRDEMSILSAKAQHTLLISDSCFSGTLLRRGANKTVPATNANRYYDKVSGKKSVQIITAGGVEYVDDDYRNSGHSPFTYFLLNELKNNNQPVITVSELSSNVEKAVANNVDQVPASGVLHGAGDELGEFIFLKLNIDVSVSGIPRENVDVKVNVAPANAKGNIPVNVDVKPRAPDSSYRHRFPIPTL